MPDDKQPENRGISSRKKRTPDGLTGKAAIFVVLCGLLAFLFPVGSSIDLDYEVGGVWVQKDLIAPFSFPVYREEADYARDVAAARKDTYPVFRLDAGVPGEQLARLKDQMAKIEEAAALRHDVLRGGPGSLSPRDSARYASLAGGIEVQLTDREWELAHVLAQEKRLKPAGERLAWILRACWDVGVLDQPATSFTTDEIAVREGAEETVVRGSNYCDQVQALGRLESDLREVYGNEERTFNLVYRIGATFIVPNLLFDETATGLAVQSAVEAVPRTVGFVQEDERIVSKHERITAETRLKLESYQRAKADRTGDVNTLAQFTGIYLHVLIVIALYAIYLGLFRKRIFGDNRRLLLISLLILVQGVFAYITRELDVDHPVEYLIAVPVTSMLLAILFDSRVAFYGTVVVSLLVGAIMGNDYAIALSSFVAGALSVYTVRDIRNRTQIFRSMGFIFLGYSLSIIALALERSASPATVLSQLSFAFINALVSPVLTYGLLIFFERVFRVTTDLTLIELSHFNHPLLRQMAEKAPGTYHHSMTIASLAETAAASIGANDVLARVGAFFHDIGKLAKPSYFVENQRGTRNRHEKLTPRMSSLIIQGHVKDGVEIGREHRLPEEILDFIPMHHGTTRIDYFYGKALEMAGAGEKISEADYRYPGPKPATKETGILMLADAIEARVRSLDDQSPENLERTIDEVVRRRFEEGELDECPLTLKDLTKIREAFLQVLVGVYHARVKYPRVSDEHEKDPKRRRQRTKRVREEEKGPRPSDEPAL
jgi:putative nucleotidyltransferase with HDIG domain